MFDVDDDAGTSTVPHFSVPSEEEEEEVISNNVWEHVIDILLNSPYFTLMVKASENGLNIKTWMTWRCFTNGMRSTYQLVNSLPPTWRIHGIQAIQNS